MQAYNHEFAIVFNSEFTSFVKKVAPLIEQFYFNIPVSAINKSVLDLCCGTGQLACEFLKRGYDVVGIDGSEHMLAYARENTREFLPSGKIELILGDILEQSLGRHFGLVTCTYDSINHLDNEQELTKCFELAYRSLVEGGHFIFDINTRLSLRNWNAISVRETPNAMIVSRGLYDGLGSKAIIKLTGFSRKFNGLYERFEQVIYNAVFETAMIEELLLKIGWSKVHFARIEDLSIPISEPEKIDKENELFIIACK